MSRLRTLQFLLLFSFLAGAAARADEPSTAPAASLSIVAWDSATGDLGACVLSSLPGCGSLIPFARADIGIVITEGDPCALYGEKGLELLAGGASPHDALTSLLKDDSSRTSRQVAILNPHGDIDYANGSDCLRYSGVVAGKGVVFLGTGLPGEEVLRAMFASFGSSDGELSGRLVDAALAGFKACNGKMASRSASLLVVRSHGGYGGYGDRFIDLRVDDDTMPLLRLNDIYRRWESEFLLDARLRSIDGLNAARKFDMAREELKRIVVSLNEQLRRAPDQPETLRRIAWILATREIDRDRALELAKRAATLAPESLPILSTLAECHFRLGHTDEAIAIASRLVEREPANDLYWRQLRRFKDAQQQPAQH